jgi:hypothetical protein
MNVQKKLIGDILSLYDTILEKKNLDETTSNLRSTLNSLGYREKNYDLTTGGDVNDKLTDIVATILKQFKTNYPTAMVTVTSGNDRYHQNLGYKSQHTMGNAIDVVISPYDSKSSAAFLNILNATVKNTPGFTYLDEYTKPSKASTGGHYHLQYGSDTTTTTTSGSTSTTNTDDRESGAGSFARKIGGQILKSIGIEESLKGNPKKIQENIKRIKKLL